MSRAGIRLFRMWQRSDRSTIQDRAFWKVCRPAPKFRSLSPRWCDLERYFTACFNRPACRLSSVSTTRTTEAISRLERVRSRQLCERWNCSRHLLPDVAAVARGTALTRSSCSPARQMRAASMDLCSIAPISEGVSRRCWMAARASLMRVDMRP